MSPTGAWPSQPASQTASQLLNQLAILASFSGAVSKAQFVDSASHAEVG